MKLNGFFQHQELGDLEVPRPEADLICHLPTPKSDGLLSRGVGLHHGARSAR